MTELVSTQEAQSGGDVAEISEAPTRVSSRTPTVARSQTQVNEDPVHLSIPGLLLKLLKSPRALSAVFLTLSFGYEYGLTVSYAADHRGLTSPTAS